MAKLYILLRPAEQNPAGFPGVRDWIRAFAMEEVVARLHCARVSRHQDYASRDRKRDVTGENYLVDVGTWAATAPGLSGDTACPIRTRSLSSRNGFSTV